LKSRVSKRLGLDETASGTEDVLLGYELNDAVRDVLTRTRCNVNKATDTIDTAGQDQDLSAVPLLVLDISVSGSDGQVWLPERTTRAEILRMARGAGTGSARYYAHEGSLWSFYPALAAGDIVTLYYVPKPTEMSSGSHDPATETYGNIPVEFHPALIEYAAWKMADYDDDGSSQQGVVYQGNYERLVRQALKTQRLKGGRSLGRAIVGRRAPLRTSNSQDW
jgi:hypothetical protein